MTYLGNPKADHRLCQIRETSLPNSQLRPVVHSESTMAKMQIVLVHLEANGMVHSESRGALQSKGWCTPNQILVHLEARNGALGNNL